MEQYRSKINITLKKQLVLTLAQTLVDIQDVDEAVTLLNDFLSEREKERLAVRLGVAYWLKKKRDKNNIKRNLQVTSSQISRIEKIMNTKGVRLAIKKIEAEEWANVWETRIKKLVQKK